VYPTTFVLYADFRFGWDEKHMGMIGLTLLFVGVLSIIVNGALVKPLVKNLGERRAVLFGLACGILGFLGYGLASTGTVFWLFMPLAALWGVANPAIQAIMTHHVEPTEQGKLQGALGALNSIAGMIAPLAFTHVLATVARQGPQVPWAGATFWLASALLGIGLLVAWRVTRGEPEHLAPAT
jgi:DHA1 family tetracycline resistance protein-like MFS transporter